MEPYEGFTNNNEETRPTDAEVSAPDAPKITRTIIRLRRRVLPEQIWVLPRQKRRASFRMVEYFNEGKAQICPAKPWFGLPCFP